MSNTMNFNDAVIFSKPTKPNLSLSQMTLVKPLEYH